MISLQPSKTSGLVLYGETISIHWQLLLKTTTEKSHNSGLSQSLFFLAHFQHSVKVHTFDN